MELTKKVIQEQSKEGPYRYEAITYVYVNARYDESHPALEWVGYPVGIGIGQDGCVKRMVYQTGENQFSFGDELRIRSGEGSVEISLEDFIARWIRRPGFSDDRKQYLSEVLQDDWNVRVRELAANGFADSHEETPFVQNNLEELQDVDECKFWGQFPEGFMLALIQYEKETRSVEAKGRMR